jgi:hypothetical protein
MSNDAKIKISADLQDFDAQLSQLRDRINEVGKELKNAGGKFDFKSDSAVKSLDELYKTAEKVSLSLANAGDGGNLDKYTRQLGELAKVLEDARKQAARLETALGKNAPASKVSRKINEDLAQPIRESLVAAGPIAQQEQKISASEESRKMAEQATADAKEIHKNSSEQVKLARELREKHEKWANAAGKLAGFAAGAVQGGGGMYAQIGAAAGSLLPGWWGVAASQVGGVAGGVVDNAMNPVREEAKNYSEIRQGMGGITLNFSELRDTTQELTKGLLITNVQASALAQRFAKTAGLVENAGSEISKAVAMSAGLAKSLGLDAGVFADFFGQMRAMGASKGDDDNKRFAINLAESFARSGKSIKADDDLAVIRNFVTKQSESAFVKSDPSAILDILSALTGTSYPGMSGNPLRAGALMNKIDDAIKAGGANGESSIIFQDMARQRVVPTMSTQMYDAFQQAGATIPLKDVIAEDSPLAKDAKRAHDREGATRSQKADYIAIVKAREELEAYEEQTGRVANNFNIIMDAIIANAKGNPGVENTLMKSQFGVGPFEAPIIKELYNNKKVMDELGEKLAEKGIDVNKVEIEKLVPFAKALLNTSPRQQQRYMEGLYDNMKHEEDKAEIKRVLSMDDSAVKDKKVEDLLVKLIDEDKIIDPGEEAAKTQIDILNKIQASVKDLVEIESSVKEAILAFAEEFLPDSEFTKRLLANERSTLESLIDQSNPKLKRTGKVVGKSWSGNNLPDDLDSDQYKSLSKRVTLISEADTVAEAKNFAEIYKAYAKTDKKMLEGMPENWENWVDEAVKRREIEGQKKSKGADYNEPWRLKARGESGAGSSIDLSLPASESQDSSWKPGTTEAEQQRKADLLAKPSRFDPLFEKYAAMYGHTAKELKAMAIEESGLNPKAHNPGGDSGLMQISKPEWDKVGITEANKFDPEASIRAGAIIYKRKKEQAGGNIAGAIRRYNGSGIRAMRHRNEVVDMLARDQARVEKIQLAQAQRQSEKDRIASLNMPEDDTAPVMTAKTPEGVPETQQANVLPKLAPTLPFKKDEASPKKTESAPVPEGLVEKWRRRNAEEKARRERAMGAEKSSTEAPKTVKPSEEPVLSPIEKYKADKKKLGGKSELDKLIEKYRKQWGASIQPDVNTALGMSYGLAVNGMNKDSYDPFKQNVNMAMNDKIPEQDKPIRIEQKPMEFSHKIDVTLYDHNQNVIPNPVVRARIDSPRHSGSDRGAIV